MGGCDLVCVHPVAIDDMWPHARGFIESAFDHGRGDDNAEIVLADLKAGGSLLWIIWDRGDRAMKGAVTTKLVKISHGLVCRITACGGLQLHRWAALLTKIENYAKAEGCMSMRIEGRRGWKAIFPDYAERWIMLEKRL
jgi:hypothetical protein